MCLSILSRTKRESATIEQKQLITLIQMLILNGKYYQLTNLLKNLKIPNNQVFWVSNSLYATLLILGKLTGLKPLVGHRIWNLSLFLGLLDAMFFSARIFLQLIRMANVILGLRCGLQSVWIRTNIQLRLQSFKTIKTQFSIKLFSSNIPYLKMIFTTVLLSF